MPLSLSKLNDYLERKGMVIHRYYIENKLCMYIEVVSSISICNFLVYIPSKYRFSVEGISSSKIIKLLPIPVKKSKDSISKSPDKEYIENLYSDEPEVDKLLEEGNIPEKLEDKYNSPIEIKNLAQSNLVYFRDISRQVDRLKFSVANISYKIGIIYQGFFCITGEDYGYFLSNHPIEPVRKLFVILDIDLLYDKILTIEDEISQVISGIYRILDKNYSIFYENMIGMIEKLSSFSLLNFSEENVSSLKESKKETLENSLTLLSKEIKSEKEILKKLKGIIDKRKESGIKGLYEDMDKINSRKRVEDQLSSVEKKKEKIMTDIFSVKEDINSISLTADKVMFDNIILIDEVLRNLDLLSEIINPISG